jgi:restriction endonuclease S subunit
VPKLADIATITTGVYQKASPSGDVYYLQGKDFDENGFLRRDVILEKEVLRDEKVEKHLLNNGDILLIAKGESNKACIYYQDTGPAVASSVFFVIRIQHNFLLPEFLQWLINTDLIQKRLFERTRGTHIRSLSKKALVDLEIEVPKLSVQKEILKINDLWKKEQSLTLELLKQKELFYQTLLLNKTKEK